MRMTSGNEAFDATAGAAVRGATRLTAVGRSGGRGSRSQPRPTSAGRRCALAPDDGTLRAIADGEVADGWRPDLDAHVQSCEECRERTQALRTTAALAHGRMVAIAPNMLFIHPVISVSNLNAFIALAKSRPGQLFASSSGRATVGHMSLELFNAMGGTKVVHVPYKGAGPAIIDLVAGHVQLQFSSLPLVSGHVQQGRIKLIAQTGDKRAGFAKDIPTMIEAGMPGYVVSSGFSFIGPAGIPRAIGERLNQALVTSLRDPANRKFLLEQGAEPVGSSLDEHETYIKSEVAKWIKVVKQAGIEPQ